MSVRMSGLRVVLALGLAFVATPALALLVQPVVIDLQTSGEHSSAALTVTNDRNRPDTVEVTVNKLVLPEKGPPTLIPDKGDDFLIFPPLATIAPGKTQVIRIRWVGDPVLAESRTYMFSTTELPVDQSKSSGVQLVYSIQSVVTVTSPGLKGNLHVVSVHRDVQHHEAVGTQPPTDTKGISVLFSNVGNAIEYVSHYRMVFSTAGSPGWSKTVDAPDVSKSVGLGLLSPNSKRELFFPLPDAPASGTIQASLEAAPNR